MADLERRVKAAHGSAERSMHSRLSELNDLMHRHVARIDVDSEALKAGGLAAVNNLSEPLALIGANINALTLENTKLHETLRAQQAQIAQLAHSRSSYSPFAAHLQPPSAGLSDGASAGGMADAEASATALADETPLRTQRNP